MVRNRDFINDIQLKKEYCIFRQLMIFCLITLLKVVLVYFNNDNYNLRNNLFTLKLFSGIIEPCNIRRFGVL